MKSFGMGIDFVYQT